MTLAAGGRAAKRLFMVSLESAASLSPFLSMASVAMMPGPPAFVTIAIRSPCGSGCMTNASVKSNRSAIEPALMVPDCLKAAS